MNKSLPKGKLISLWKSVSFKGNFFDHYENVPIHKLGWPSVKLCRRQPRWKKRSSAIMNTKIFWINIKQAIIWKHFKSILNQSCKFLQRPIERCRFCVGPQSIGSQCNRRRKCFFGLKAHMCPEGVLNWKKHPSFLLMPNSHKLRKDSKNVNFKIGPWGPKKLSQIFNMPIIKSVAQKGPKYP